MTMGELCPIHSPKRGCLPGADLGKTAMLPEQDNQRNLVLAFALSLGVLMAWQFFYVAPRSKVEQET